MYHRYGRHGARAWLRWHKKHTAQPTPTSLVPVVRPITIQIFVPANAERIIFIVTTQNFDEQDFRQELEPVTEPRYLSSPQEHDRFPYISTIAVSNAKDQAEDDLRIGNALSSEEITEQAKRSWRESKAKDATILRSIPSPEYDDAEEAYIEAYISKYNEILRKMDRNPIDATTSAIWKLAREDKRTDSITIPMDYLHYQAAFQVKHLCNTTPLNKLTYLEELDNYVNIYIQEYQRYKVVLESEDRSSDRSGFRRQWQQY